MALVQRIIESKGIEAIFISYSISNGWWERFRKRHPNLTLKSAMPLTYARAMATDSDVFHHYYDMLEETLKSNGIFDNPTHIFNCDETGLPYGPEMINIAALNQIIIFALPPHTTHVTQPLDRACFAPLKIEWRRLCHKYISENSGKTVSQYEFCELFSKAWSRAFTIKNIVSSFKVTGVFPFNRSITATHFLDKKESEENFSLFKPDILAQKTGLAYIPLYSPSVRRSKQAMITRDSASTFT